MRTLILVFLLALLVVPAYADSNSEFNTVYYYHAGHTMTDADKQVIIDNYTTVICPQGDVPFWLANDVVPYVGLMPRVVQGWELPQWEAWCDNQTPPVDKDRIWMRGQDCERLSANDMTGTWFLADIIDAAYLTWLATDFIPWALSTGAAGLMIDQPFLWGDFVPDDARVTKAEYNNSQCVDLNVLMAAITSTYLNVTTPFWGRNTYVQAAVTGGCSLWFEAGGIWTEPPFQNVDMWISGIPDNVLFGKRKGRDD